MQRENAQTIIKIVEEQKPSTLEELVDLAKTRLDISDDEVLAAILRLQDEGKINLRAAEQRAPQKLVAYLMTADAHWYWITLFLATATTITVWAVPEDAIPAVYIRHLLGTLFLVYLPGYSLVKALFPAKSPLRTQSENLDIVERAALSLGLSIALVPIIGLLLNYTPWGIRLGQIILGSFIATTIFATIGIAREHAAKTRVTIET